MKNDETSPVIPEISKPENDDQTEQLNEQPQTPEFGPITPAFGRHRIHCLNIIGQIEGHYILPAQNKATKYEQIIPQLAAFEESSLAEGLLILLNTVGGDVEAGLAIAEMISGMSKPTVSLVLGGGHSIGVPLAVSANVSYIVPSATMTIHPVRMNGLILGVPQAINSFLRMQDRITAFVAANSHISEQRFTELMMTSGELITDIGTVISETDAVNEGIIDHSGNLRDALNTLYQLIEGE